MSPQLDDRRNEQRVDRLVVCADFDASRSHIVEQLQKLSTVFLRAHGCMARCRPSHVTDGLSTMRARAASVSQRRVARRRPPPIAFHRRRASRCQRRVSQNDGELRDISRLSSSSSLEARSLRVLTLRGHVQQPQPHALIVEPRAADRRRERARFVALGSSELCRRCCRGRHLHALAHNRAKTK